MTNDEYKVIFVPFPGDIYGCVRLDNDGFPTVYINVYLSPEARKKALAHELKHITQGDFYSTATIQQIEGKQ